MGEFSSKKINEIGSLYESIITEQPAKGVTAKVGPVRIGVTDPKTDIGARASRAVGGFLSGLKSKAQQFGAEAERRIQRVGGYTIPSRPAGAAPTAKPTTPTARPAAAAPAARPAAAAPAARPVATVKSTPTPAAKPTGSAMDQWRANFPKLAAKVTPAGTQRGTGQSTMAKQASELRSMQAASQERQAAQSGPMYSSPDVKSKMSARAKNILGVKEQYDAYDLVLEYLLSQGHVETLEEALYVMMEMSPEMVQSIVEAGALLPGEAGKAPSSGYKQPILPGEKRLTPKMQEPAPGKAPKLPPA